MRYAILITIAGLFFVGCKKDNSGSAPQLQLQSTSTNVVARGETLTFTLSFSDPNDVSGASLYARELVQNCSEGGFIDTVSLPQFPYLRNQPGTIILTYQNGTNGDGKPILPQCNDINNNGINDTAHFQFVLTDDAHHSSDTVNSGTIVVIAQ